MQFSRCSKLRDDVLDPGRRVRLYPIIALNIYIKRVQDVAGSNLPRNHLWKVLLIDSLLYSPITAVAYLTIGIAWMSLPIRWRNLLSGFSLAGTCITGTRLMLNLRRAYYLPLALNLGLDIDGALSSR